MTLEECGCEACKAWLKPQDPEVRYKWLKEFILGETRDTIKRHKEGSFSRIWLEGALDEIEQYEREHNER